MLASGDVSTMAGTHMTAGNADGIGCGGIGSCPSMTGSACYGTSMSCPATFDTPFSVTFHQRSNSLFVWSAGLVRRIE